MEKNLRQRKMDAQGTFHDITRWEEQHVTDKIPASLKLKVDPIDATKFIVKEEGEKHVVDLKSRTCQCLIFLTDELPCIHAIAAINNINLNKSSYCAHWFTRQTWLKTYEGEILLVGSTSSWIISDSLKELITNPSDVKVLPRRRQTTRRIGRIKLATSNF